MKRANFASVAALGLLSLSLPGCLDSDSEPLTLNTVQAQGPDAGVRNAGLRFKLAAFSPLVYQVQYQLTNNASGEVISRTVNVNQNLAIPGGIPELNNRPLDPNSKHHFTDLFESVPAGSYKVELTPLGENGVSLDGICYGGRLDSVVATAGKTSEFFLMIQCSNQGAGALDIIAAVNHAPQVTSVTFEPVGQGSGGGQQGGQETAKYTCGDTLRICAEAQDVDNNPLSFFVDAPLDCTIAPGAEPSFPYADGTASQCFDITCPNPGNEGRRIDITVNALDMAWRAGNLVPMETVLRDRNILEPSRGVMETMGNFLSAQACEGDPDCNDASDAPELARDLVLIHDSSQSMSFARGDIQQSIPGLFDALNEQQTASNEKCPAKFRYNTRMALVSTVDKPFSVLGAVTDWVFRAEHGAVPKSRSASLLSAFSAMEYGLGAGPGEAQIEALLNAAQNMDDLGFNATSSTPRYAVLLTNSVFLSEGNCPWQGLQAPVCQEPNNLNGVVDLAEDYPSVQGVAQKLREHSVYPIFVLVNEGADSKVFDFYQSNFINQSNGLPAVVTSWSTTTGESLATVVKSAIESIETQLQGDGEGGGMVY